MENHSQNQIAERQQTPLQKFNQTISNPNTQKYLDSVLGEKKSSFVNNLTALVANDAKLQDCKPMSLIYAALKATALDLPLDPNLGFAYVIPYNNRTGKEAQFQIGYKGFIQLALRSCQFQGINVRDVRSGELIDEDMITGEVKIRRAAGRESLPVIGYVAFFSLTSGFSKMSYMTVEEIKAHAGKYSKTFSSDKEYVRNTSKWVTDFDAMAKKTVLKLLLSKYAPMSVETLQLAVKTDQSVYNENGIEEYADNPMREEPDDQTSSAEQPSADEKKAEMRASGRGPVEMM